MTWPSFRAASIKSGVTASGGGAAAITRVESALPASRAPAPWSTPRRETIECFMGSFIPFVGDVRDTANYVLFLAPIPSLSSTVHSPCS